MDTKTDLFQTFRRVDRRYGPVPLWWWDAEEVTPDRIRWQMAKLKAGGIDNLCVINLAPQGPNFGSRGSQPSFYSEPWWACWDVAVRTAERLQMYLWYYDQIGFSGANFPAQLALAHPEYRGFHLRRWPLDEARATDGPAWLERDGFRYHIERGGFDWLNPEATAVLLDQIHGEMARRYSPWLGRVIVGSFQDELPPLPTWSNQLVEQYRARYGTDLRPEVPRLFDGGSADTTTRLVRRRVYEILGAMAEVAFFKPLAAFHERHPLIFGCDQAGPGREADPYGAQRLYLDYSRTHRWFSAPGNDPEGEIKPHASLAHQWRRPRVWLEAFHSSGWGGTIEDTLHWLLPWFQAGATLYNPHAIYYSTMGGWWEWAAPDTGWRQPYFEHYAIFAEGIARLSKLLSQGHHVADIALYYPGRPLWADMTWPTGRTPLHPMVAALKPDSVAAATIEQVYWSVAGRQNRLRPNLGALRRGGWDFDTVDDLALAEASWDTPRIQIAEESYQILIFPGTEDMDAPNQARVQQWIDAGGVAIGIGVAPHARKLSGVLEIPSVDDLDAVLSQHIVRPIKGSGPALLRQVDPDTRVMLVLPPEGSLAPMHDVVTSDRRPPASSRVWLQGHDTVELWDPWQGHRQPLATQPERDGQWITLPWTNWPAALLILRKGVPRTEEHMPGSVEPSRPYSAQVGPTSGLETRLSSDGWTIRVEPTLDNRYGDFDRHSHHERAVIELRTVEVATDVEDRGVADAWYESGAANAPWVRRLWSEATYWRLESSHGGSADTPIVYSTVFGDLSYRTWAGRMARIPRTMINLGSVEPGQTQTARSVVFAPNDGDYWLQVEGEGIKTVDIGGTLVVAEASQYAVAAPITLEKGWHPVTCSVMAAAREPIRIGIAVGSEPPARYPQWVAGGNEAPRLSQAPLTMPVTFGEVSLHFVVFDGVAELSINGHRVAHLGDAMPYSHWGQTVIAVTPWLEPGDNVLQIRWLDAEPRARAFVDGIWTDESGRSHAAAIGDWTDDTGAPLPSVGMPTEEHWLAARPHLLPDVGWLQPDAVPEGLLSWAADPIHVGKPVWLRVELPVGATRIAMALLGQAQAWVDGIPVVIQGDHVDLNPGPAGRVLMLRIQPDGFATEAAVLAKPIYVQTAPAQGRLGDWSDALKLPAFSGVVEYEQVIQGTGTRAVLDLGEVRGTAEVWVDGWNAGVRLWHPYRFDLTPAWGPGEHRVRIRVTNTLGAFYSDGKPTGLCPPAQQVSGLFGPVRTYQQ